VEEHWGKKNDDACNDSMFSCKKVAERVLTMVIIENTTLGNGV
jgi:hypothetical protein